VLIFEIINNKQVIRRNGIELLDLTHQSMDYSKELKTLDYITINDEIAGRPHTMAKIAYGTESNLDLLMDFNGISNPMTLDVGEIIMVPDVEYLYSCMVDPEKDVESEISNNNKKTSKITDIAKRKVVAKIQQKDPRLTNILENKNVRPNEASLNDSTFGISAEDGVITLGTNTSQTRCKSDLSEIQKITEKIRKTIRNEIDKGKIPQTAEKIGIPIIRDFADQTVTKGP
jgi:hypothetical protein